MCDKPIFKGSEMKESVSYWGNWKSVQLDGEIQTVVRREAGN